MKSLNLLKTLLDLFFFFGILTFVGMTVLFAIAFLTDDFSFRVSNSEFIVSGWTERAIMACIFIAGGLFLYAMYLFRAAIQLFVRMQIFADAVIVNFRKIGMLMIISTLLANVPVFFYNMFHHNSIGLHFGINGLDSGIISICLGLFFIVLSQVFRIARNLKEENDLTI